MRKTGINILGDVPWGTHFCQFYQSKEDLIDILVPYFKAGLENNEFCMWVTSEPLKVEEAKASLKKEVKNLDNYIKKGQIEIFDASQSYTKSGRFESEKVLKGLAKKESEARKKGFDGLRLTGNTFWLDKKDWRNFTEYEKEVNNVIGKYRILAICSYSLDRCGASEIIEVVNNHQFAIIKQKGKWELIESSERKRTEEILSKANTKLQMLQKVTEAVHSTLDLDKVFRQITEGFVHSMGYTTAFILTLNNDKKCFEFKAFTTKKRLLRQIERILGFSVMNFLIPADPNLNNTINSIMKGKIVVTKSFAEIAYPIINKKKCSVLQKLRDSKNYIVVPLEVNKKVVGGVTITSPRGEVPDEELRMIKSFANAASNAVKNASLHMQTKQAEERIKTSLREKEVLLQEIHHRVKNNLQVISSLLKLQSEYIRDKQDLEMFKESQNRVRSMALIHEKLYQSKDLAKIDFAEYIKDLSYKLFQSYEADPGKIALTMDVEEVLLRVDTAIPCGLIINELVSNSLQHAFPQGREGEIKAALRSINKNEIELRVSDNGIGLPEDLDFRKTKSLGLHLVTILGEEQLKGKIRLKRSGGTEFKITFKRDE